MSSSLLVKDLDDHSLWAFNVEVSVCRVFSVWTFNGRKLARKVSHKMVLATLNFSHFLLEAKARKVNKIIVF